MSEPRRTPAEPTTSRSRAVRRRARAAVALALAGALVGGPALADDLDDIRQRIREVEQRESRTSTDKGRSQEAAADLGEHLEHTSAELEAADRRLQETTAKVTAARVVLEEAEADLADAEAEAERIEAELAVARANEASIQESLQVNEEQQQESRTTVGAIARDSYKQGGMGSLATTLELLSGEADAVDRMAMARTVLRVQDQQIRALATQEAQGVAEQDRLAGVRQDIAYLLAQAEANVVAMELARTAAEEAKVALEALEAQQVQDKAALEAEKAKVESELKAEQERSDQLTAELAELAASKQELKGEEQAEVERLAEEARRKAAEEARRQAEEEARRQAAEEAAARAAAEEAARQQAAERAAAREAQRQREVAAEAERRRDQEAAAEAQRRAEAAQAEADRAAQAARDAAAREAAERRAADERASRDAEREREAAVQASSGYLSYPMNAPTTSEFGNRLHPILGVWLLHSGLDFGAPCGTPVTAASDGVVYGTLYDDSRGNYVVVDHGVQRGVNLTTAYLHLESFAVSSGQSVSRGQVVGYEGTTGSSTGCHLHFETRENGTPVNPRTWL
ncbi:peptidoglycan DD-metalloendopeptidase family protein [Ornithinimicrobium cerasi]|uniref:peptidoglycan DD-metalloendopeptidase family protein n=1 Tax=Ornithinimicrobium cerasi TaxID=2248773 RepID=UPI000F00B614|nr:M23 family metallopeptidase [Ornithinimicrobium cerasi]